MNLTTIICDTLRRTSERLTNLEAKLSDRAAQVVFEDAGRLVLAIDELGRAATTIENLIRLDETEQKSETAHSATG